MDKRTLLFVVALSLSLFLVNTFFDYQNQENRKEWSEQQVVKSKQKIRQLETLIQQRTVSASSLPIAKIYSDTSEINFLNAGVISDNAILTIAWDTQLPAKVYSNSKTFTLAHQPQAKGYPAVYYQGEQAPLKIGQIPEWGQFDLQLVTLSPQNDGKPYSITFGEYLDGHFSLPAETLFNLKRDIAVNGDLPPELPHEDSIVLFKTDKGYLPVAIYQEADKRLYYLNESSAIATTVVKPPKRVVSTNGEKPEETYYVLENDYQQLVFSTYGAALVEVNLPFETATNTKSVVKEIEFDRDMVENHPYNARFPAHPYYTPSASPEGSFEEHDEGKLGGYYPLIRRDLIEIGQRQSVKIDPKYYALNIVSEYPELAELAFTVKHFDKNSITFEATQENRRITKTYQLDTEIAPYTINLTINIEGNSRGLWLTSGIPEVELISNSTSPALKYRITRGDKSEVKLIDLPTDTTTVASISPDWICDSNGFFGLIVDPLTTIDSGYRAQYISGSQVPTRLVEIGQDHDRFPAKDYPAYQMMLPLWSKGGTMQFRIFAGPFSSKILKTVDAAYSDNETGYNPDYIACQSFHGWFSFISEPFAKFLFILMNFFYQLTGSWAFSIVLLTVALKVMLYPLNAWSTKSMLRTQQIMPKVQAIQAKYKNDPKKSQMEILNLYKEEGVNPLSGMTGGCFPLLIQMPFLIGMFDLLKSSFQLRGATFIPGWINDLAAPDILFSWSTPIPFIGTEFHLLPVFLGVIMFIQPRIMSPLPKDKSKWSEQQKQQRMMGNMMAIMFTWLFYNFPSGLNIYWMSSMLLGILQQWWTKRQIKTPEKKDVVLDITPPKGKQKKANR
jgi:YidC/Oxa1 family membrane protein insertase